MIRTNSSRLRFTYWTLITILTVLNLTTAVFGFHPHHDGLMLATVRQLHDSYLHGGDWPFNQYGLFWALPYLLLSLLVGGSHLLLAMRIFTLFLYVVSAFLTYKIAFNIFGNRVAKISLALFVLLRPLGLEPIPWPSSISMVLTISALWILLRSLNSQNTKVARALAFAAGALTAANIFSRVQVGAIIFIAVCLVLIKFNRGLVWFFFFGSFLLTGTLFGILGSRSWLIPALQDEFLFGWLVAGSEDTDKSFPKTSLVIAALLILVILLHRMNKINFNLIEIPLLSLIMAASIALYLLNRELFTTYYGKIVVGIAISFLFYSLLLIGNSWKTERINQILLYIFAVAAASQIYPLFDVMHTWWAVTPLVILMAVELNVFTASFKPLNYFWFSASVCSVLLILPYLGALGASSSEVSAEALKSIRLPVKEQQNYEKVSNFLHENIEEGSLVLNLCPDATVFFEPEFVNSASRYFVYWKTMGASGIISMQILASDPQYILVCNSYEETSNPVFQKYTSEPFNLSSRFQGFSIYTKALVSLS